MDDNVFFFLIEMVSKMIFLFYFSNYINVKRLHMDEAASITKILSIPYFLNTIILYAQSYRLFPLHRCNDYHLKRY